MNVEKTTEALHKLNNGLMDLCTYLGMDCNPITGAISRAMNELEESLNEEN